MTPEQFQRVEELYFKASDLTPAEWEGFLQSSCPDDAEVRDEVNRMLSHAGDTAELSLVHAGVTPAAVGNGISGEDSLIGQQIGRYLIIRKVGEGGMGIVYEAQQKEPVERRVALKLIKIGMDTNEVIARFESERQALALMSHPNVARVLDAGATEQGRPYFVMEFVGGVPITKHCDDHKLDIEERLDLFMQVCDAVQHAHQKGIIHRDIKPGNVLVEYEDGQATPKVIDFGIAKATNRELTERTLFTERGQMIGTPEYMSPEQAEMSGQDIDTRCDIYSLGVLLYELLTGALPFDPESLRGAAQAEMQRIIREVDPPKPSTRLSSLSAAEADTGITLAACRRTDLRALARRVRGDLDWIVMKCLEKDRARRYETPHALILDLQRHMTSEPVLAGPPSASYRLAKFVRRNRGAVIAATLVSVALIAGIAGISWQAVVATRERDRADKARTAETEQRQLAEVREREATEARAEAQTRADELKIVTEFQQSMLGDIDAAQMGRELFKNLVASVRESLAAEGVSPDEADSALADFETMLYRTNATDAALKLLDEQVLSRAVKTIESNFADKPLTRAALQQTVAATYREIGRYAQAMLLQDAALNMRRAALGDEHPTTLTSIDNKARLLKSMGRFAEAKEHFREALEGRRRALGEDDPDTFTSINNMGFVLEAMGELIEAEAYFREALAGRRKVLGNDHPDTLESIHNMGFLLKSMGRLAEAKQLQSEALEGCRRVLGDDHPGTLTSITAMGMLLKSMGNLAEAEPYFREALEGRRRVLGSDHTDTLTSINNMGFLLKSMGKVTEAESYYREALEGQRRVLGNEHLYTLISMINVGSLLRSSGKLVEAEPYCREALAGCRHTVGDNHPITLKAIRSMGSLLRLMGKFEEAGPYLREALEGSRRALGDNHPDTLSAISSLGDLLESMDRNEEAEELMSEAVDRAKRFLPEGHWHTGLYLTKHGKCLAKLERYADAEMALLEACRILEATRGSKHKSTIGAVKTLVYLYDLWHGAEPDRGYDTKADEYRAKLPAT